MAAALVSISSAREDLILVVPGAIWKMAVRHSVADCWHSTWCIPTDHAFTSLQKEVQGLRFALLVLSGLDVQETGHRHLVGSKATL